MLELDRRADRGDPVEPRQARRSTARASSAPPWTASVIGVSRKGGKSARSASSTWRALASARQHLGVDRGELDADRNGIPSAISSAALAAAIRPGKRITSCESRYQKPSCAGRASRSARRLRNAGRERVDALAEQGEDGGEDDERDRGGDQRHQRAADPHRVEEALREDDQRGDRAGDGQRAEQDRAPGGRHRPLHRLEPGAAAARSPRGSGRR